MRQFKMYYLWIIVSVLCFLYFLFCCLSVGFRSAFNYVWLFGALACAIVFFTIRGMHMGKISLPMWFKIGFVVAFTIACVFFFALEGLVASKMFAYADDGAEYVIVLGAHVKGDVVSRILRQRLDAAYEYVMRPENSNTKIIVTGGKGRGENIAEGDAMKKYLVDRGVKPDRIFVEKTSTDTNENLENAKSLYIDDASKRIIIVSSNFHMYRSLRLAKARGLGNCEGIAAPCSLGMLPNYMVREAVGITKEIFFGNF